MKSSSILMYILILALIPISYFLLEKDRAPQGPSINEKAPELALPGQNEDTIRLSALQGNIVLVNFWASWCKPCREKNPEIVKVYEQFKDQSFTHGERFEIYSVSLDRRKDSWLQAIEDDNLSWDAHVSELKRWETDVPDQYGVSSIPDNVLLDAEGKVIAKSVDGEELEEILRNSLREAHSY